MKARMMIGIALVCIISIAGLQTGQEYFQKAPQQGQGRGESPRSDRSLSESDRSVQR